MEDEKTAFLQFNNVFYLSCAEMYSLLLLSEPGRNQHGD